MRQIKISVVIPTKNRPDDLFAAVSSIASQSRLPDELCIVDQSRDERSKLKVDKALSRSKIPTQYIHDTSILGLVEAKSVSVKKVSGDLICFLEDDIVLEKNYLVEIERGFIENSSMLGCCGIITNPPVYSKFRLNVFRLFHTGLFYDKRVEVFGNFSGAGHPLILSNMISGGVSAWRREVFKEIEFDVRNQFHMYEDIDFSLRVYSHYHGRLFINPNARLAHNHSPIDRAKYGELQKRKLRECVTFYKKNATHKGAFFNLFWLLFGLLLDAIFQTIRFRDVSIFQGYFLGLHRGIRKKLQ